MKRAFYYLILTAILVAPLAGCESAVIDPTPTAATQLASHSKETEADYDTVFPQDTVNRIDITLTSDAWDALQTEMEGKYGQKGSGNQSTRPTGQNTGARPNQQGTGGQSQRPNRQPTQAQATAVAGLTPTVTDQPADHQATSTSTPQAVGEEQAALDSTPSAGLVQATAAAAQDSAKQQPRSNENGQKAADNQDTSDSSDTTYVPSTIAFNGESWEYVGFRYSGNSTLRSSWRNGTLKISFRLDFDEFEDEYPVTKDQRFFGFKQLAFKSNAMDSSYLREKVSGDIFQQAGVIAPETAFYAVYLDYGEGSQYIGLYTVVEIVDDTLIETQFSDDSGNVYKPEGSGAAFVDGTFDADSFEKQTNQDEADWSDIEAVFFALNSDLRTTDPAAWREGLEQVFDVDAFIHWLAVDTVMQDWDTYGSMAHNYYLYTDPSDGLVTWIPWDNNQSLSVSSGGQGRGHNLRSLDLSNVSEDWPLIRFIADDPVYLAKYQQYLAETIQTTYQPENLTAMYQQYHDLIKPYVEAETEDATQLESLDAFDTGLEDLIQHAQERYDEVVDYLDNL